jgi:hypothetical protein
MGGQLALPTVTQTRWYLGDLERAELNADAGSFEPLRASWQLRAKTACSPACLSTRTAGLVRLPKKFAAMLM